MEIKITDIENGFNNRIIDIENEKVAIYLNDNVEDKLSILYMYLNMCYIAKIKGVVIQDILKKEFLKYDNKIKNSNNLINASDYIYGYLEKLSSIDNCFVKDFALAFIDDVDSLYEENSKYIEIVNNKPLSFDNKVELINYLIGYACHVLEGYCNLFEEDYAGELSEEIDNKLMDIIDENILNNDVDYSFLGRKMQLEIANLLYKIIDYNKIASEIDLVLMSELDEEESKIYKLYLPMQLACVSGLKISRKSVSEYLGISESKTRHKTVTFLKKASKITKLYDNGKLDEYIMKRVKKKIRKVN